MPLAVLAGLAGFVPALSRADSVNSPNITMNVDTNRTTGAGAGNTSVTVNTITLAETNVNEYSSGATKAVTLKVRPGFQFDSTSNITAQSAGIGFNGGGVNVVATVTPSGAADEVITFSFTSGTTGGQDVIRINGIKLKILSAVGAAGPAQTTMTITTSTAGGAFTNQGIVAATITKGAADRLQFSIQPGSSQAAADLLPAVKIVDFGGNIVTADARTITLAIQTNPGAAALNGTKTHLTASGVATWVGADDLNITTAANGYTLRASHDGASFLTSNTVDSGAFDITAGAPNHLAVTKQPVNTAAGDALLIDVSIFDALNNLVPGGTPVNITLDSAINPGGWPLLTATSLTKATVNGVASWAGADALRINSAIDGYKLSASGLGNPVETNAFNITVGTASLLRYVQQPTNVNQGALMNPPVLVEITDAFGNRTASAANVKLSLQTAPCGGSLTGNSADAVGGLATFGTITIDTGCTGDQLSASSAGLPSTSSDLFNVIGAAAACGACGAGTPAVMAPLMLVYFVMRRRNHRVK